MRSFGEKPLFTAQAKTKGMPSKNYQFLVVPDDFPLPVERVCEQDCQELDQEFDWHDVWSDISLVSRNPDHQQIHYNFIHRIPHFCQSAPHEDC